MAAAIPSFVVVPAKGFVKTELIVNCVIIFLVLTVVSLRVFLRFTGPGLGLDDVLIIVAAPLGVGMLICQGFLMPVGGGYDLSEYPDLAVNIPFILLMSYIMEIIYVFCLASAKASMLLFYRRAFLTTWMQRAVDTILVILAIWTICFECACIFLCKPASAFWTGEGTCGDFIPMIQVLIATNAVGDLVVMALPMSTIWSLHMRKTEKLGIMSCFALGLACIVIAVFRVIYLAKVNMVANITGTMPPTVFLFALEPNLAILCVSIPMLRPFYSRYISRNASARLYDNSKEPPSSGKAKSLSISNLKNGRTKKKSNNNDTVNTTTWEMDDYYNTEAAKGNLRSSAGVGASFDPDETGSEKALTRHSQNMPTNGIGVETTWVVTRNQ
ncbi:hypothetical protein BX600DRAFT_390444 [Xylariales sp. PMI_506]|nr:hypothetical protein BX600DRAFT_390444 [Xylariales sp. PMI_506]